MLNLLKEKYNLRTKKINKIEKLKQSKTPQEAINNLKNLKVDDDDRAFFLKCFGCYYKEKTDDYMIRVRITNGTLTPSQANTIAQVAKDFGKNCIDLTTRSQIELRYIKEEELYNVLTILEKSGISTYQTGVDNFRGIVIDPLAGISKSSIIDESKLAIDIQKQFLKLNNQIAVLPRKFNIGICGNIKNNSNVFGHDLGFVLSKKDGVYGFKLFLGGKVGKIAQDSGIFVTKDEVVLIFNGIKELFTKYGFRDNRNKNRFYYLLEAVGIKNFVKAIEELLGYKFQKGGVVLTSKSNDISMIDELKNGKFGYKFIVPAGIFNGDDMLEASKLAEKYKGEIRLTVEQNFYITNVDNFITSTPLYKKYKPNIYYNNLIACAGEKTCSYGVIKNKDDAINLALALEKNIPLDGNIKFHWSGCVKGCGIHGLGDFGFVGAKLKKDKVILKAVDIHLGGTWNKEGVKILKAPLDKLYLFINPIILFYKKNKQSNESFEQFIKRANYTIWAYAFVMKLNSIGFDFTPSFNVQSNKIEIFEIKEIANQISYKLTKTHLLDNIFSPIKVTTLTKDDIQADKLREIFNNMLRGKYLAWTEIIVELDSLKV